MHPRLLVTVGLLAALAPARSAWADGDAHRVTKSVTRLRDCEAPPGPAASCRQLQRRVEIVVPRDWTLSDSATYPGLLVSAAYRGRGLGRMTLAYQEVDDGVTAREYSERNRRTLEAIGFQVARLAPSPSGAAFILEALAPDRRTRVRQGYVVEDGVAYVLTLAAPAATVGSYRRAFDDTLRGLSFARTAAPRPEAAGEEGGDGASGDGPGRDGPSGDGPGRDGPSGDGPGRDGASGDGPGRDGASGDGPGRDGGSGRDRGSGDEGRAELAAPEGAPAPAPSRAPGGP